MSIRWSADIGAAPTDGTPVLLNFDWAGVAVVGFHGPDPQRPGSRATRRVKWDHDALDGGYDEPTHWAPLDLPTGRGDGA